jgi:DNA-directed RNA polymerase I subunit RPA49
MKRDDLVLEFGSAKTKKSLESKLRNQVMPSLAKDGRPKDLDAGALATLQQIEAAAATMATREELAAAADSQKPIPRPNQDAKVIQDVYRPESFIGTSVLGTIDASDWLEAAQDGTAVHLTSRFVAAKLNAVALGVDAAARLRLLRYLFYLITFHNKSSTRGPKSRRAPPRRAFQEETQAEDVVVDQIRQKFADRDGAMTTYHVSLLMTHVLALAAIIENFEFDMEALRMDLGQTQEALTRYFLQLGGKVRALKAGGNLRHVARLALPLEFPKLGKGPRRKR